MFTLVRKYIRVLNVIYTANMSITGIMERNVIVLIIVMNYKEFRKKRG